MVPVACLAVALITAVGACSLHQAGVSPPENRVFFPSGAMIDPQPRPGQPGRWLYVVNSNSDLRYNAGTLTVVDLDKVRQDDPRPAASPAWPPCSQDPRYIPPANAPHGCCQDLLDPNVLVCDEQAYVLRDKTIRFGSFGGTPVMQKLPAPITGGFEHRLFVPTRGDSSITMLDVLATTDDVSLYCTGSRTDPNLAQAPFARCEDDWRISRKDDPLVSAAGDSIPDDQIQYVPDEPYALAEDDVNQLLYVGHLAGGQVSLIDLGDGTRTDKPNLIQTYANMISPDAAGNRGITSMTIQDGGNPDPKRHCPSNVYFSSRYRPVIDAFVLFTLSAEQSCAPNGDQSARNIALAPRGDVITTGLSGAETRGIEFVDGGRAFVLQRTPPALVAIDMTVPSLPAPYASIEVCQGPTSLAQQKNGVDGPALFVTCFDSGQVYVIDPTIPRVKAVATIGHGPIATIFDPNDNTRAYVIGFGDNNLSVLNIDTRDALAYHVMQRIGYPSSVPREVGP